MRRIISILFILIPLVSYGQEGFDFSGQFSSFINYSSDNEPPLWGGARYIPELNYGIALKNDLLIDMEISANIFGNAGTGNFKTFRSSGKIKPYRGWLRLSSEQFELRAGLQKLNFGSANILRPLMWFDQLDPTDPLQLTDGVWGLLGRYYFLNNVNIWAWGLYGNKNPMGWEFVPSNKKIPEYGGRVQFPIGIGEMAFTYHHRVADMSELDMPPYDSTRIPEDKFGFDTKIDKVVGFTLEGSYTWKHEDLEYFTHTYLLNAGVDYTFPVGQGLYAGYEHLLYFADKEQFAFEQGTRFSLLTLNYTVGLLDNISTMMYYDWTNDNLYSFLSWQRRYDNIMLHFMGFWNPPAFELPSQQSSSNFFAGKGFQIMFVFNH